MDIRKVKKLIELMEESDIAEIEIKEGDDAVRISRRVAAPASVAIAPSVSPSAEASAQPGKTAQRATTGHIVHAPMVGTFYRAPSPGSPPFVDSGTRVKAGDVLCIIESMKMMNQVKADKAGRIEAVLADNGSPVEFDQPLFTIV